MWIIADGVLRLVFADNSYYMPSAKEIYTQKDNDFFEYKSHRYAALSSLNLRYSSLVNRPQIELVFEKVICLRLLVKGHYVNIINDIFLDYIIIEDVWRYIDSSCLESVNRILSSHKISPNSISYREYIMLVREFHKADIDYSDKISEFIKKSKTLGEFAVPKGLQANLFVYQKEGLKWLEFMASNQCGCLLGDEMGLGKTLQIIALFGALKEKLVHPHFLVVCPVSLLENWKREFVKFYPSLKVNVHYGSKRTGDYRTLLNYDVNIMSYGNAITDSGLLTMVKWNALVIDEAQNIKNPMAKRTKAVKRIKCDVPIAITGTPFENRMTDIWSLVDYILPGFLGSLSLFERTFSDDVPSAIKLEKIISPLILRRRVADVAKELPKRIDIPLPITMSNEEAMLYEDCRKVENVQDVMSQMQLAKIQKLRTFCTHPCVYDLDYSSLNPMEISNKYNRLCEILDEIFLQKEKVVIFTSFKKMIKLICTDIKSRFGVYTNYIDGSINACDRQAIVDEFSEEKGSGVLVLNPKAAGTGLNITCANHAIHYNLEWNPAVEDQASARIYRRGQNKTVFIYRLYYANTIEEIINDRIQKKRMLSDKAIIGNTGEIEEKDYILKALEVSPYNN